MSAHSEIVTEDQLLKATGYEQRRRLACILTIQGVRYFVGKEGRIWTTAQELSRALSTQNNPDLLEIDFE